MLDPPVLLLDEPLGALDPVIRHELQAQMRELFATLGKTVVLVTHDVAEAAWLADTLVLLRAGRIVQQGSARALAETPADPSVAQFMTAPRSLDDALGGRVRCACRCSPGRRRPGGRCRARRDRKSGR